MYETLEIDIIFVNGFCRLSRRQNEVAFHRNISNLKLAHSVNTLYYSTWLYWRDKIRVWQLKYRCHIYSYYVLCVGGIYYIGM